MRRVIWTLVVLAFPASALAADLDILRGAESVGYPTFSNWSGFYFGGQAGASDINANFANSTQDPIAYVLRETTLEADIAPSQWPVLGTADHTGLTYGGFIGYNTQWQDLVLGIEGNYNHTSFSVSAPSAPIARLTPADSGGNTYIIGISAIGTMSNFDYGTLRLRAGWIVDNYFLPYAFAGFALGHSDLNVTATVSGEENPPAGGGACVSPCVPINFTAIGGKNGAFMYGGTVGTGMDVALTRNVFLRGEYEYTWFAPVSGITVTMSTFRGGGGFKF